MKLIFVFLIVARFSSSAQCRYDVNEYDKFLKINKLEKEVKINNADFGGDGYLKLNFCKYDSSTFFRITYIKRAGIVVGPSDALIFLLADDSTVKAYPVQIYSSSSRALSSRSIQSILNATYNFENYGDIEKLKTQKVRSIRIYYNSVYEDEEIKGKFSENLYETAQCF